MRLLSLYARLHTGIVTALCAVMAAGLMLSTRISVAGELNGPQVKAWFVVNFIKFTDWPQGRPASVNLCVIGQDATAPAFVEFEGRVVGGTSIHIVPAVAVTEAEHCHIAYIATSEERRIAAILKSLSAQPVLTVSDIEGFIDQGGMIGIVAIEDRYVFEVNLDVAHAANLQPGTPMLRLARRIINTKGR